MVGSRIELVSRDLCLVALSYKKPHVFTCQPFLMCLGPSCSPLQGEVFGAAA